MTPTGVPAIERSVELQASPERVWRALTEPAELSSWFGQRVELDLRAGGLGWFEWDDGGRFHVRIEAVEPPSRLRWRWARDRNTPVDAGTSTVVEFLLEPRPGGGTWLRLREAGFGTDADRGHNRSGWFEELGELLAHLASRPWEAGIRRSYPLRSAPERVWRALAEPAELAAWWGGVGTLELRPGFEGWWEWPSEGRFAMRIEAVEAPSYLAWRWTPEPDTPLASASQVLLTEWLVAPGADGGTILCLLESGFRGPKEFELNSSGWDSDVIPGLRRQIGETAAG